MGNLQFKRGLKTNLPTSATSGTPLWCTDTKELYIGTGTGVERVGSIINTESEPSSTSVSYDAQNKKLILGDTELVSESYSKDEIDEMLGDSYTKDEIDSMFDDIETLLQEI